MSSCACAPMMCFKAACARGTRAPETLGGLAKGGNAQLYEIAIPSPRRRARRLQSSAEGRHNPAMSCFDLLAAAAAAERPAESLNSPPIGKRDYHRRTRPTHTKFQKTVMGSVRG